MGIVWMEEDKKELYINMSKKRLLQKSETTRGKLILKYVENKYKKIIYMATLNWKLRILRMKWTGHANVEETWRET